MGSYPIVITSLEKYYCVVVGGGVVATRKVQGLVEAGSRPKVISPKISNTLKTLRLERKIKHVQRYYKQGDCKGALLIFAATNDSKTNETIVAEAKSEGALINNAQNAFDGNFITPANLRRGDLLLSVSTGSASPILAAYLKNELSKSYGEAYAQLISLVSESRQKIANMEHQKQQDFIRSLTSEEVLEKLEQGLEDEVRSLIDKQTS